MICIHNLNYNNGHHCQLCKYVCFLMCMCVCQCLCSPIPAIEFAFPSEYVDKYRLKITILEDVTCTGCADDSRRIQACQRETSPKFGRSCRIAV